MDSPSKGNKIYMFRIIHRRTRVTWDSVIKPRVKLHLEQVWEGVSVITDTTFCVAKAIVSRGHRLQSSGVYSQSALRPTTENHGPPKFPGKLFIIWGTGTHTHTTVDFESTRERSQNYAMFVCLFVGRVLISTSILHAATEFTGRVSSGQ